MIPVKYMQITKKLVSQAKEFWSPIPGFENYKKADFIYYGEYTLHFHFEKGQSCEYVGDYIVVDCEGCLHIFPQSLFELIFKKEIKAMQDKKMQELVKSLGSVVASYAKMANDKHYEIGTYIFDCSNDGIIVYASFDEFGNITLDDDLYTLSSEPGYQGSKNEKEMIRKFIGPDKKVILDGAANIIMKTTEERFITDFFYYVSLLLKIGTMLRTTRKKVENEGA